MNNINIKVYLAIGAVFLLMGTGFIIYLLFFAGKTPQSQLNTSGNAQVNNSYPENIQKVLKNPKEVNGDWLTLYSSDDFIISYGVKGDIFAVDILTSPAEEKAKVAEDTFVGLLGVDKTYACKLNISVKVPDAVDPRLSGYDFGFSFCPSAKHMEDFLINNNDSYIINEEFR